MRTLGVKLLGLAVIGVVVAAVAACSESPSDAGGNAAVFGTKQPELADLAFIVWTCADLECLNLETSETATHTYTACSAVLEDAEIVGISICEGRKRLATVVSRPATCTPLGTACPNARSAYNWDDTRKTRIEESDDAGADPGASDASDASVP
jgi:hypothetical protein